MTHVEHHSQAGPHHVPGTGEGVVMGVGVTVAAGREVGQGRGRGVAVVMGMERLAKTEAVA